MVSVRAGACSDDSFCQDLGSKLHEQVFQERSPAKPFVASSPCALSGEEHAPSHIAGMAGGSPPNGGSVGHPIVCSRPCLYFSIGECVNGDSCGFCHMPHNKRPPHLDKQHRAKLGNMVPEARRLWLLAIIKAKLIGLDASEETQAIIEDLTHACRANGVVLPEPTRLARADRMLWKAMDSLTLRVLLVQLRKNLDELDSPPTFDTDTVIKYCQNLVEARGLAGPSAM